MAILVRAMEVMLIKRRKKISQQRVLAFTKRLATMSLHLLHNGSLACLGHVKNVLQVNFFPQLQWHFKLSYSASANVACNPCLFSSTNLLMFFWTLTLLAAKACTTLSSKSQSTVMLAVLPSGKLHSSSATTTHMLGSTQVLLPLVLHPLV